MGGSLESPAWTICFQRFPVRIFKIIFTSTQLACAYSGIRDAILSFQFSETLVSRVLSIGVDWVRARSNLSALLLMCFIVGYGAFSSFGLLLGLHVSRASFSF